jgi:rhodanese-related sulfurtransferase/CBS domain-containing protein
MPQPIDRDGVRSLVEKGAQLVEVLPAREYGEDHLPAAISLPLRKLEQRGGEVLDRERAVIVYCWDSECDLSARGAWRLQSMGFTEVYDYTAGKLDWLAAGLPTEGSNARQVRAADVALAGVPTCAPDELLGEVARRVRAAGWDACVVVNPERVVLGLLRARELDSDGSLRIERAMRPGPSTFRPHVPIAEMARFMTDHDLASSPITTSDGRLVGLLRRSDALRVAELLPGL